MHPEANPWTEEEKEKDGRQILGKMGATMYIVVVYPDDESNTDEGISDPMNR